MEEQEEELRALREYIGPGSKPTKKMCKICNTQRETKKIEKHVQYCLKYFQFARKDEEKSNEYSCKFCQKSGFDPIGRLYYHIETRHSRMFDNKKEKTPFITKEMMSKSTHRTSFPLVSVNNQLTKANILSKKGKTKLLKHKTDDLELAGYSPPQRRRTANYNNPNNESVGDHKIGTLSELNRLTHGSWANIGGMRA